MKSNHTIQLSVIMPCLNEENTVGICVDEISTIISENDICGEIIVVDNGSTDSSASVALSYGAKVIFEQNIGYGHAIRRGLSEASGKILIIMDCDTTYDSVQAKEMYDMLNSNKYDVVIGDRFAFSLGHGIMPLSHRLGVRFLSALGRMRFHTDVRDFHCGLRGLTDEAFSKIKLHTSGMEFATEIIAESVKNNLYIGQMPVELKKSKMPRSSKLRTFRDGLRHLVYIIKG